MDPFVEELREAIARRYAERTADSKLPVESVPDFRPSDGVELETYGFKVEMSELPDDAYKVADWITDYILDIEDKIAALNPEAMARVYLGPARYHCPQVFRAQPWWNGAPADAEAEYNRLKVRHDFTLRVPKEEMRLAAAATPRTLIGPRKEGEEYRQLRAFTLRTHRMDFAEDPTLSTYEWTLDDVYMPYEDLSEAKLLEAADHGYRVVRVGRPANLVLARILGHQARVLAA